MTVYLLYYDTSYGGREEWNTFYTPVEAFSTSALRAARMQELEDALDDDEEPYDYDFHTVDVEVK